jgi:hypothetical protein
MDDQIRTSDADRERVTARLRDHYAEGRLTRDELDERITAALNAKTFGDLRRVLADLPEPRPVAPERGQLLTAGRPYPVAFRRGPRLLPLMALVLLALVLIPGAGAAAVLLKVFAISLAFLFTLFLVSAFTAARFIRRAHRNWYADQLKNWQSWQHGNPHQAKCWRS